MIVHIANPIYDSVFKYLMEDERIAKTILSALLKKDVVKIEARPHEYSNQTRDSISMFRIDFSATVREAGGTERLILVELQKTWLETETLRFRQYLGAQYSDKRNMRKDSAEGFALPMVTIYIMGHRVGDIDEAVIYVNHKSYDYNGNEVTKGMPDPFIESLVHNSIIVQIPLLHGQINNRLDKVLSVFDQTKVDMDNSHFLNVDERTYEGDENMKYIVHRLTEAAANAEMRQNMNVEDEYYSAIENRDTAIMNRDKRIKEQDEKISEQSNKISEQSNKISEQSNKISEQSNKISEQSNKISEQSNKISEQSNKISEQSNKISEQSNKISEQSNKISEQSSQIRSMAMALHENGMSAEQIAALTGIAADTLHGIIGK